MLKSFNVIKGPPMRRQRFPMEHPTEPGFSPYAVAQRLAVLRFAAWIARRYQPKRRGEAWLLVTALAELETMAFKNRPLTRVEKRLLADVTFHLWSARESVNHWAIEHSDEIEDLVPGLCASIAVRRLARGDEGVLTEQVLVETRRAIEKPLTAVWAKIIISALLTSHERVSTMYSELVQRCRQSADQAQIAMLHKDEEIARLQSELSRRLARSA